jgi:hypothetical protein
MAGSRILSPVTTARTVPDATPQNDACVNLRAHAKAAGMGAIFPKPGSLLADDPPGDVEGADPRGTTARPDAQPAGLRPVGPLSAAADAR